MKDLITFICFLALMLAPGESLSCITCKGKFGCEGPAQTCESPEDVCLAIFSIKTKDRFLNSHSFIRKCGSPKHCLQNGKMKTPSLEISFNITCCNTDSCAQERPIFFGIAQMLYKPSSDDKVLCPTCDLSDPYRCTEKYAMPCSNSQDLCATFSESSGDVTTNIKGCATESFCLNAEVLTLEGTGTEVNITCMSATKNISLPMHYFRYCSIYTTVNSNEVYSQIRGALCLPDEEACMKDHNKISYYGQESTEEIQKCARTVDCDRYGIITHPDKTIQFGTSCCYSDMCIVSLPELPAKKPGKNGISCRSCFSSTSDQCPVQDRIECTGNETSCVRYTAAAETQGKNTSYETLYGCATDQACSWGNRFTNYGEKTVEMKIQCVESGSNILYAHQIFIIVVVSTSHLAGVVLFNP